MSCILICHFVERRNPSLLLKTQRTFMLLLLEGLHARNSLWYGAGVMQLDSNSGLSGNQADLSIIGAFSAPQTSYPPVAVIKDLLESVCFAFHLGSLCIAFSKSGTTLNLGFQESCVFLRNKGLAG